jgi:uncharacterized protein (TIGR01244 family)
MDPIKLADQYYVLAQITEAEMVKYCAQGFEVIINNRPDNESEGQPLSKDLAKKAQELGVRYIYNPVDLSVLSQRQLDQQKAAVSSGDKVLAFCRTGTRSSVLWVLNNQVEGAFDELVGSVNAKGFDLTRCLPAMEKFKA